MENVWSPDDSGAYIGDFNGSKPHTIRGGGSLLHGELFGLLHRPCGPLRALKNSVSPLTFTPMLEENCRQKSQFSEQK